MKISTQSKLPFNELWKLLKKIPKGKVSTYKAVAEKLCVKNPRNVGYMLKHNPNAPAVPCHRVISSSGRIGGYSGASAGKNIVRKTKLLASEGVDFTPKGKIADPARVLRKL